jgi:hypothetical protein
MAAARQGLPARDRAPQGNALTSTARPRALKTLLAGTKPFIAGSVAAA